MRIGVDASPAIGERGGVGWHTYHLLHALLGLKEDLELLCYVRPGSLRGDSPEGWTRHRQLQWVEVPRSLMRWRARRDCLDLFHGPNFRLRGAGRSGGVVTIHDFWLDRHPEYSPKAFGQRLSRWRTQRTVRRARKVIAVSRFTAQELQALYEVPNDRIAVIYNGVSEDYQPARDPAGMQAFREQYRVPTERFILFVGGADPRKNHRSLVAACARHPDILRDRTLVLVGDQTHRHGSFRATATEFKLETRVICPGRVGHETLRLLYSHADVFVFPSWYEGFGIPVLEAMACGAPVITSTTSALPEVAGDAAVLTDPADPGALGQALERLLDDERLRARLRAQGYARAKEFPWSRAAQDTMALYRELCGQ